MKPIVPYTLNSRGTLHSYQFRIPGLSGYCLLPNEEPAEHPMFLGVEIECIYVLVAKPGEQAASSQLTTVDDIYSLVANLAPGFLALKHDGSLPPTGMEINTPPATLAFHRFGIWETFFAETSAEKFSFEFPGHFVCLDAWNTAQAGMHIHLNKASLTPLGLGRLIAFFGNEHVQPFITKLAGRKPNNYCVAAKNEMRDVLKSKMAGRSRYEALNLTSGKTVEFRIFRSSITRGGVFSALEFVHSIASFCNSPVSIDAFKRAAKPGYLLKEYLEWLTFKDNAREYPFHLYHISKVCNDSTLGFPLPAIPRPANWFHEEIE